MGGHRPTARVLALLALPAVLATAALLVVAAEGSYASPDSAFYVGVARNVLGGDGLAAPPGSPPLGHFPPLFPMALAGLGRVFGVDPLGVTEVLNPVLFAMTGLLVAFVVYRRSGSVALAMAGSGLVVTGLDLLVFGASALSEPLFLILTMGAMVVLAESIARRSNGLLTGAAALAGAACLTRYVGVAVILAGTAAMMHLERRAGRRRAAAFAVLSAIPPAVWLVSVGRTNREVTLHLFNVQYWASGISSASRWVLPPFVPWPVRLLVMGLGLSQLRRLARLRRPPAPVDPTDTAQPMATRRTADPLPFILGAFALCYLGLLAVDRLLLDISGRLDGRFLAPLHVAAVMVLLPLTYRLVIEPRRRVVSAGWARRAVAGGLALLALHGLQAGSWIAKGTSDTGVGRRGLSGRPWRESPVLATLAGLPVTVPVYSNAADAVFMLIGRRTSSIPARRDYLNGAPEDDYATSLAAMRARLHRHDGVIVFFTPFEGRRPFLPTVEEVTRLLPLEPVAQDGVATMYRPRRP